MIGREHITGAILAGGQGRRMGGADKGLMPYRGRPLVHHVIDAIQPQVGRIIVSANRHLDRYAGLGFPVVPDRETDFGGPLAGIARVLDETATSHVLIVPCDMPSLPKRLAVHLAKALAPNDAEAAVAHAAGRLQPLCILIARDVAQDLRYFRESGGSGVEKWLRRLRHAVVNFSDEPAAFRNINAPCDLLTVDECDTAAPSIALHSCP